MPALGPSHVARIKALPHLAALRHRDYRNTWTANMLGGSAMWTFMRAWEAPGQYPSPRLSRNTHVLPDGAPEGPRLYP